MKHFVRTYALRELRSKKKLFRSSFLLILFVSFTLTLVFSLGESIARTVEEQRYRAYGAHRYYGSSILTTEAKKKMNIAGVLTLYGEEIAGGTVGTADGAAQQLGRISCLEGRLPQQSNEVAMEIGALSAMGYSYDLGQEITLQVSLYSGEGLAIQPVSQRFLLCGTLQNRSPLWSAKLPSIFLTEEGGHILEGLGEAAALPVHTTLIDAQRLSQQEIRNSMLKENLAAYPDSGLSNLDVLMGYLAALICAVCAGLFIAVIDASVKRREDTWRTLRQIGASRKAVFSIVLWEECYLAAAALPIGLLFGTACSAGTGALVSALLDYDMELTPGWLPLAAAAGLSFACVLFGAAFAAHSAASTAFRPRSATPRHKVHKTGMKGRVGPVQMLWSRVRLHPVSAGVSCLIIVGAMIFSALLLAGVSRQAAGYRAAALQAKNCDYFFDTRLSSGQGHFFDASQYQQLEEVYGVEAVFAYRIHMAEWDDPFTLDLSQKTDAYYEWMDMEYRSSLAVQEALQTESTEATAARKWEEFYQDPAAVPVTVTGLAGEQEARRYLQWAETSSLQDMDKLLSGESCILYLPAIFQQPLAAEDSQLGTGASSGYDYNPYQAVGKPFDILPGGTREGDRLWRRQGKLFRETTAIQPGDTLQVCYQGKYAEIEVAAVLRTLPADESFYPTPSRPYEIITGKDFYTRFPGYGESTGDTLLTVRCAPDADYLSTDKQISLIQADLGRDIWFMNNRLPQSQKRTEFLSGCALSLLLLSLYFVMTVVLLNLIAGSRTEENRKRIAVYKMLGADNRKIRLSFWLEGIFVWLAACILALMLLYGFWIAAEVQLMGFVYPVPYYLFPSEAFQFQWGAFGGFAALLFVVVLCLTAVPLNRFLRENPADQMRGDLI